MCPAKKLLLHLIQSSKKVLSLSTLSSPQIIGVVRNRGRTRLEALAQHVRDLIFIEQFQRPYSKLVVMRRQASEVDGTWIGFQSIDDAWREAGWEIERAER